jgi:transcriptional regulator GlxA family with amidase domain
MTNIIPQVNNIQSGVELGGFGYAWVPNSYRNLSEDIRRGLVLDSTAGQAKPTDVSFIRLAISVVEKHFSNYKFNIQTLALELKISRRQLFRKFQTFAGCTPNVFIRNLRLKHAAGLLQNSRMTILEVTYAVGFCDPKYFRIVFREKYGMLPSIYAKQYAYGSTSNLIIQQNRYSDKTNPNQK